MRGLGEDWTDVRLEPTHVSPPRFLGVQVDGKLASPTHDALVGVPVLLSDGTLQRGVAEVPGLPRAWLAMLRMYGFCTSQPPVASDPGMCDRCYLDSLGPY